MTTRVSTGLPRLDTMLGGGLLPGTLTVIYGATGIGKTHLGLTYASHGRVADGRPGILFDMNVRGDSQQHHAYAERLFGWPLRRWTHTVMPMADPYPPPGELDAYYCDAFPWAGKLREYQLPSPDGFEFDWNWKAAYNAALYTVRPFVYFHLGAGSRRIVVDGIEPMDVPADYIQPYIFDELYRKTIHREAETLGMELCLPVWKHREYIDGHLYDHRAVTTLLLVTTEETQLEHLLARKVASGDIGAVANTILILGSERVGSRLARYLAVVKHRGSAMSDEFAEYRVTEQGLQFV
ncbi:MAG TPA: ATPase domain-containing protein [Pseudomonadales bacterium]|nr:ATPase domain-containing protein [Pseudomonadales bacterium]